MNGSDAYSIAAHAPPFPNLFMIKCDCVFVGGLYLYCI